ncbi:MAG: PH domain-containing protein [Rickettsiales bacterium]
MPTLDEVWNQINSYKHSYIFWTKKEVRALPEILSSDEQVKAVTSGLMNNATWLAVCTNKRIIFLNRGMLFGLRQLQVPLERIQSIDHGFTVFFGSITVWDGASAFQIRMVLKSSIMPFVKVTQEQMQIARKKLYSGKEDNTPSNTAGIDIASQLERLAALREKGHLTEEEFQSQKKKLLAG